MARSTSFFDLRESLAGTGCAICFLAARAADRYLESLLWEGVNDPGLRDVIRRSRGFCSTHSKGMVRHGAALGVSIIARDVLQDVLEVLHKESGFQSLSSWSPRRFYEAVTPGQPSAATAETVAQLMPQAICPACAHVEQMEGIYLDTLLDHLLGQDGLLADYRASDGLCLPHLGRALALVRDHATFDALIDAQQLIWQALVDQLSEAIRKNDWRFQDEPKGEEMKAWLKALAALAGN